MLGRQFHLALSYVEIPPRRLSGCGDESCKHQTPLVHISKSRWTSVCNSTSATLFRQVRLCNRKIWITEVILYNYIHFWMLSQLPNKHAVKAHCQYFLMIDISHCVHQPAKYGVLRIWQWQNPYLTCIFLLMYSWCRRKIQLATWINDSLNESTGSSLCTWSRKNTDTCTEDSSLCSIWGTHGKKT